MRDIALVLKERMGEAGRRVPTGGIPDIVVRGVALFDPAVAQIVPELGRAKSASNEKAKRLLGWSPRSNEEAILASAQSLVERGLVKGLARAA
jgi:dihydroflavonol-4-reductase